MSNSVHGCMQKEHGVGTPGERLQLWMPNRHTDTSSIHRKGQGDRRLSREEKAMAHLFLHPLRGSDTFSEGEEHGGTVDKDVRIEENLNSGCLVHT